MMAYHHILVHETLHCHRLSQHQSYQSKLENQSPLFQFQFGTHPKLKSYAPVPQESHTYPPHYLQELSTHPPFYIF